jgi:hypothetical protein
VLCRSSVVRPTILSLLVRCFVVRQRGLDVTALRKWDHWQMLRAEPVKAITSSWLVWA